MMSWARMAWASGRIGVLDCAEKVECPICCGGRKADIETHCGSNRKISD